MHTIKITGTIINIHSYLSKNTKKLYFYFLVCMQLVLIVFNLNGTILFSRLKQNRWIKNS